MSSIYRKAGANGKLSPNWQAKFRGLNGDQAWLSTKLTDRRKAASVAALWEECCRQAECHELTQDGARKVIDKLERITRNPRTLAATDKLLAELLEYSVDEEFKGQDFAKYCEEWLTDRQKRASEGTLRRYRCIVSGFTESLSERRRTAPVASISSGEIRRFLESESLAGKTTGTLNVVLAVLRALFNSARNEGLTGTNPAKAIERFPAEAEERVPFTEGAVKLLLKESDIEWKGMILLGMQHGLRILDAANLTWANIDLVNKTLSFRQKKTSKKKKAAEKLTVLALHADLVEYFSSLAAGDDPQAPLFPNLYGLASSGRNGPSARFIRLMGKAKLDTQAGAEKKGKGRRFNKLTYHSFRHAFISRLANNDVSMDVRKSMSGHSSDAIHLKYTHMSLASQRKAIAGLSSVL